MRAAVAWLQAVLHEVSFKGPALHSRLPFAPSSSRCRLGEALRTNELDRLWHFRWPVDVSFARVLQTQLIAPVAPQSRSWQPVNDNLMARLARKPQEY